MYENRTLVRSDNLEEMRNVPDNCIDLIATDPPFNRTEKPSHRSKAETTHSATFATSALPCRIQRQT